MGIFSYESARRIGDQNVLRKGDVSMDWSAISVLLKHGLKRLGLGLQSYKQITLFKCLLIAQWHNLSDPKLEECLRVRIDFMLVTGLDLQGLIYRAAGLTRPRIVDFARRWLRRAPTMRCLPRSAVR